MTLQIVLWFNFMDYVLLYFVKLIAICLSWLHCVAYSLNFDKLKCSIFCGINCNLALPHFNVTFYVFFYPLTTTLSAYYCTSLRQLLVNILIWTCIFSLWSLGPEKSKPFINLSNCKHINLVIISKVCSS